MRDHKHSFWMECETIYKKAKHTPMEKEKERERELFQKAFHFNVGQRARFTISLAQASGCFKREVLNQQLRQQYVITFVTSTQFVFHR